MGEKIETMNVGRALGPPTRKRVLVLTSTFPRWKGDVEPAFVYELCRRLAQDYDITVLAPHALGAQRFESFSGIAVRRYRYCLPRMETLAYEGGILARLKQNRWRYLLVPLFFVAQLLALLKLLTTERFAVLHAHWVIPQGLVAVIACGLVPKPPSLICTSHGGDLFGLRGRVAATLQRLVFNRSSALTVVSNAMLEYAEQLGAPRRTTHVIPMGVDVAQTFTPGSSNTRDATKLLFVGRLVEKKGCRYLLEAMPAVLARFPNATLSIIGSGPEEMALRQYAEDANLSQSICFLGPVRNDKLPELYRAASIVVVPSVVARRGDQEGLGLVIVEALGCGCAVVASDLPAIKDVITHGMTGLITEAKNSADLAAQLITLLEKPALREHLGRSGRAFVLEHFDWSISQQRYRALYEHVTDSSGRADHGNGR